MKNLFNVNILKNYTNRIIWNTTYRCNFVCPYCFFSEKEHATGDEIVSRLSAEQIAKAFDSTGKQWLILLSGGEPFLIPDFLNLLKLLSRNHHLQITSNLCSELVYKLPDYFRPERVMMISGSLHPAERKRNDRHYEEFFKKYWFLKKHGYPLLVNIVTYPPQITEIPDEINYLRSHGIDNVTVLTYRGYWNNKYYPGSYSAEELKIINKYCIDNNELLIAENGMNFKGTHCEAGMNYFSMDPFGNVTRCGSIHDAHGNLFKEGIHFSEWAEKCTSEDCVDCYLGLVALRK